MGLELASSGLEVLRAIHCATGTMGWPAFLFWGERHNAFPWKTHFTDITSNFEKKSPSREADLNHRPKDHCTCIDPTTVLRSTSWAIASGANQWSKEKPATAFHMGVEFAYLNEANILNLPTIFQYLHHYKIYDAFELKDWMPNAWWHRFIV